MAFSHTDLCSILMIWPATFVLALRYMRHNSFCEAGLVSCGISYNGFTKESALDKKSPGVTRARWDRYKMQDFVATFTAHTPKDAVGNWNLPVLRWLRNCKFFLLVVNVHSYHCCSNL